MQNERVGLSAGYRFPGWRTRPNPAFSRHQYVKCLDSQLAAFSSANGRYREVYITGIPKRASTASSDPETAFGWTWVQSSSS
jgi:hypothetical protein